MKVIILRSISGGGKTMLANRLIHEAGMRHGRDSHLIVSSDDYFTDAKGVYRYVPKDQSKAHEACMRHFTQALLGIDIALTRIDDPKYQLIVVDNTNTRLVEVAPYYQLAQAYDAQVHLVTIICDPYLAAECGTHDVPNHVMWGQHQRILSEQIPSWWKHTVCFRRREVELDSGEVTYNNGLVLDPAELLESMDEKPMEAPSKETVA